MLERDRQSAIMRGDMEQANLYGVQLADELDKLSYSITSLSSNGSETSSRPVNGTAKSVPAATKFLQISPEAQSGVSGFQPEGSGFKQYIAGIGESGIVYGSTVTVINDIAYLATATNEARPCHGVCTGHVQDGQIYYAVGGDVIARIVATPTIRGWLYQSVTAGCLTDDPAESPGTKVFLQQVGHFHQMQTTPYGAPLLVRLSCWPSMPQSV